MALSSESVKSCGIPRTLVCSAGFILYSASCQRVKEVIWLAAPINASSLVTTPSRRTSLQLLKFFSNIGLCSSLLNNKKFI